MKKFKQFLDGASLFTLINVEEPFPFIGVNALLLDKILIMNHGNKTLFDGLDGLDIETLAKMLVLEFSDRWKSLIILAGLEVSSGSVRELTENINTLEARLNSRNDVNKVSAFNSELMLDDNGAVSEGSDDLDGQVTKTLTETMKDDNKKVYHLLNKTKRDSIIKSVMSDISSFSTLSIY